jgi:transposase
VIEREVNQLDRSVIDEAYRGSGSQPFDPLTLLKMVIYQCLKGNQSPATWHEEAQDNEVMRWLGRGYVPARRTWYVFRDRLGKFIEKVHQQIVARALEQGVDPRVGVQDGTAVAACASRHRMVNRSTLDKRIGQLALILQGKLDGEVPKWVPRSDSGKRDLAKRMQKAREVLAERVAQNAGKRSDQRKDPEKIRVSLSDPDAPLGRDKMKVYRPLYTVQYVVAPGSYIILGYSCEAVVTDAGALAPMIDKTQKFVGGRLETVLADSGYCSILDLQDCQERGIELVAPVQANAFTEKKTKSDQQLPRTDFQWDEAEQCYYCPQGHRLTYHDRTRVHRHGGRYLWQTRYRCHSDHCGPCPLAQKCLRPGATRRTIKQLEGQELLEAQRAKMAAPKNQERYRLRSQTVELAYADSKYNRGQQRYHGRGIARARAETGLMVVAQNILRLEGVRRKLLTLGKIQT